MKRWLELEILAEITGNAYDIKKEEFLSQTSDIKIKLRNFASHQNWQTACTAQILLGCLEHRKLYKEVLKELDAVDVESEQKTAGGISRIWNMYALKARDQYKKNILPKCWEVIMKHHCDLEHWKLITFLAMLGAIPNKFSIEPLVNFMKNSNDAFLVDYAAQRLGGFPEAMVRSHLEQFKKGQQDILKAIEGAIFKLDS